MRSLIAIFVALAFAVAIGCSKAPAPPQPPPAAAKVAQPAAIQEEKMVSIPTDAAMPNTHPQTHHHDAPHGGALVAIGEHAGHLEFVLDGETGTITMYALDGEVENAVSLNSIGMLMQITVSGKEPWTVQLKPVSNVLTGETEKASSQYAAQSDNLKGVTAFSAVIPELSFRGIELENVAVSYPKGSE